MTQPTPRSICFVETGFVLPETLARNIRRKVFGLCIGGPKPKTLRQLGEDIWYTCAPVEAHTDDQPDGYVTTGLVLVNDQDARLFDDLGEFALPVGSVYRLWGNQTHGTRAAREGIFAALIWDGLFLDQKPAPEFALEAAVELARRPEYFTTEI